ncbi:aldehyde dehydrogenase [Scheffersomyces xylosifermentans]|uniref:aldehyde dehydrogenase n=1 Tax=Scheffersomyces xylosifermentans TaxID=1304137 RepID=UPI00315D87B8
MAPPPAPLKDSVSSVESFTKVDSAATAVPVLQHTALKDIPVGVKRLHDAFHQKQKSHSVQYRLNQLRNVYFKIKDNIDPICEALLKDFHRVPAETKNLEISGGLAELVHTMASLHKWVKPEPVTDLPLTLKSQPVFIERIPLGVVLIISPFNYPFFLSLSAIIGAIAAGNAVVFKPSELTPHFSQLFTELLTEALDEDIFFAINGGIPETTAALDQKYDKIMYTGNNTVGTIIAKKAAETLTPVILELGGKSPAFILDDVTDKDLQVAARRIAWGRFTNAGQTCVAVDYVLVPEDKKAKFVNAIVKVLGEEFYPELNKDNKDLTHVIHDRAFANITNIIKTTKGKIVFGGKSDAESRFIEPTVIDNVDWDDSTMSGEIFGPVLPILTYTNLSESLSKLQSRHDTPLAQYIFTSGPTSRTKNPQIDTILKAVRSGGTIVNDVLMHVALVNAPFGGIGNSGQGAYHGWFSFRHFTHERTTMEQKLWNDFLLAPRYPPFTAKKNAVLDVAQSQYNDKVWFGRTGDVKVSGPSTLFSTWTGIAGVAALVYYFVGAL